MLICNNYLLNWWLQSFVVYVYFHIVPQQSVQTIDSDLGFQPLTKLKSLRHLGIIKSK